MGPLAGLRVIDAGVIFAGPLVATLLGDLGADVVKIEHPKGDDVRKTGKFKDGEGLWWRVTARNKKAISIDMGKPEGAEVVRKLAGSADVLVENFRAGRFGKWGLDYASLSRLNPGLVMLHISGYGQEGPYSQRPCLGTLAEAFSGFAHVNGETDGPPTLPSFPVADSVAAIYGAYAVMAALWAREKRGGKGEEIDINLYEPLLSLMGSMAIDYDQLGFVARRHGNRSIWSVPRNAYRTSDDRWVAISGAANSVTQRLFRAIDRNDMADDPGLATNQLRAQRMDECDSAIADWIVRHTLEEVMARFHTYDVVAGPIYDIEQIFNDPQVQARGTFAQLDDPALGKVRIQDVVPRFTNRPVHMRWLGRREIGADTESVLGDLGYSSDALEQLESQGVIKRACLNNSAPRVD
ncbi:CoA transferase [Mesorhizobium sp. B1-1-3]|uniref:CaiB/BaiF CoA transferase family protein n=1 Tax=Mesorhizobium sp. B1-1-3 TaxID=2589981 RepID=UPI001AEE23A0|nr:CoA transferase [Mesorhizobium sp. B1-1-3]